MTYDEATQQLVEFVTAHYLRGGSTRDCLVQVGMWLDEHPEVRPPEAIALENLVRACHDVQKWTEEQESVAREAVLGILPDNAKKQIALITSSRSAAETLKAFEQKQLDNVKKAISDRRSRPVYEVRLSLSELSAVDGAVVPSLPKLLKKRLLLVPRSKPPATSVPEALVEIWSEDKLIKLALPKDVCEDVVPLLRCGCKHAIQVKWEEAERQSQPVQVSVVLTLFLPTCQRPDVTGPDEVRELTAPAPRPRVQMGLHPGVLIGILLLLLALAAIIRSC
jgi:hypothetical protein